jgi:predicted small metal-binding protein
MFAGKAIRCDCGYEVRADDEDGLVEAIRHHAWEEHGIDFSDELARELARGALRPAGERGSGKEQQ